MSVTLEGTDPHSARYVFGNDSVHARDQHRCLVEMLDPMRTARLGQLGVDLDHSR